MLKRLEYRLLDESNHYPTLYTYQHIDELEIAARCTCDFFVKDGVLYEKTSCSMEVLVYVIYVKEVDNNVTVYHDNIRDNGKKTRIEIRHFIEDVEQYPLLFTYELRESKEVLLYLQSDYFTWSGKEWQKTSSEIDEDRKIYVLYAKPTGVEECP